jgi:hypothetical protein
MGEEFLYRSEENKRLELETYSVQESVNVTNQFLGFQFNGSEEQVKQFLTMYDTKQRN